MPNARRPTPFAFPAETGGRFGMLVLAALVLTWATSYALIVRSNPRVEQSLISDGIAFHRKHGEDIRALGPTELAELRSWEEKVAHRTLNRAGVPSLVTVALAMLAWLLYRRHPARTRRRFDPVSISAQSHPELYERLRAVSLRLEVGSTVRFELGTGSITNSQVYGPRGQEALLLCGEPSHLLGQWSHRTETIVLHELAHLSHRDTASREGAFAIWLALGAAFAALFVYSLLPVATYSFTGPMLIRLLALILVIRLLWGSLIRIREYYADWRVDLLGHGAELRRVLDAGGDLAASSALPGSRPRRGLGARLLDLGQRVWRLHPSYASRFRTLLDPRRLFVLGSEVPFSSGLLLGLTAAASVPLIAEGATGSMLVTEPLFKSILEQIPPQQRNSEHVPLTLAALLLRVAPPLVVTTLILTALAYAASRTLGLQCQRAAMIELADPVLDSRGYLRLARPALVMALGFELGLWINPLAILLPTSRVSLALEPVWLLGMWLLLWLWLVHARALSRLVLGAHGGPRRPVWKSRLLTACSSGLLMGLFWPSVFGRLSVSLLDRFREIPLLPSGQDPWERFLLMFVFTTFISLSLSLAFYISVFGATVMTLIPWLVFRHARCSTCSRATERRMLVGRDCEGCGEPLAPWIYAPPPLGGIS